MMKSLVGILFSLSLLMPFRVEAKWFEASEFFLDNGLQVVVIENHKAPLIKHMVFYKAGAIDEKPGQGGIAHLLEHLMFRGTKKVSGQNFNKIMEENGVEINAFTAQDVTAYHEFADISRLELLMALEADRMRNLEISDDAFATERNIVFQERQQRVDNNIQASFMEKVRNMLWQNHPYANPVTGQDKEIMNLSKQNALDFYQKYYAPNNAILVLSGDIDVKTAKNLAQKYYGKLKASDLSKFEDTKLEEDYKAKMVMKMPDAKMARVFRISAVASTVQDTKRAYALEVLSNYLGGDENSPLYQRLVLQKRKALDVGAYYSGISRSYGTFVISAVPTGEYNEMFLLEIDKALNRAMIRLNQEELNKTKQKMLSELVYMKDNPESLAYFVGYNLATGNKLDKMQNYEENIRNISLEDVKNAFEYLKNSAPEVTGILLPKGEK